MTRVLIPVTYQYSVRYLLHTGMVDLLARGCEPVIALSWADHELEKQFSALGCEVVHLPKAEVTDDYRRLRRLLDERYWRHLRSPSHAIDRQRRLAMASPRSRAILHARHLRQHRALSRRGADEHLDLAFATLSRSATNAGVFDTLLSDLGIDALFTPTPYHAAEEPLLIAASGRGMRMVTSIISFDNITTRGWIPATFDHYLVWSDHNRRELLRGYPEVPAAAVEVAGAPQFDFYHQEQWFWGEAEWRDRLGIPADRPVVLFGAGPPQIVPHETQYIPVLDDAIERGRIRDEPILLVRRHPMDAPARWAEALRACRHVVYDDPWPVRDRPDQSAPDDDAIAKFCSTLRHAAVHVSTSSTMSVDGAALDRPQVGPAFDRDRRFDRVTKDLYRREHWLPIGASGAMEVAAGPGELISAVDRGLADPGERSRQRASMVHDVTGNDDGRSTQRVAAAVLGSVGA